MAGKHHDKRWARLRKSLRPSLIAQLPALCPRCGKVMTKDQRLDLGHISRDPQLAYTPYNVRLEHTSCNRRDGQRITSNMRRKPRDTELPRW